MFTEYTREEIAKQSHSPYAAERKSNECESGSAADESSEAKDDETAEDDLNNLDLYDLEGESLW